MRLLGWIRRLFGVCPAWLDVPMFSGQGTRVWCESRPARHLGRHHALAPTGWVDW